MKGFKKDGKFRPTGNKSKSSISKSDVRKKKTFHSCPDCERAEREQTERANSMKRNKEEIKDKKYHVHETADAEVLYSVKGKNEDDALENHLEGKSQEQDHVHDNIDLTVTKHGRDKQTLTEDEIKANKTHMLEDASPTYVEMVTRFPQSSVGRDFHDWAESGLRGSHGHFGDALKEGRIADAMYRADSDNLVYLDEIGIEHLLSDVQHHPDDPSDRASFRGRADWAKKYVANGYRNEGE